MAQCRGICTKKAFLFVLAVFSVVFFVYVSRSGDFSFADLASEAIKTFTASCSMQKNRNYLKNLVRKVKFNVLL